MLRMLRKLASPKGRKTALLSIIVVALLILVGTGCSKTDTKVEQTSQETSKDNSVQETDIPRTDVSKKEAMVNAAAKIDEIRKSDAPNYAEIEKIFSTELKEMVEKRDAESQTTLVADIEKAIAAAKAGKEAALNGQRISKTLIRAFYLAVKHELEEAETLFADKTEEGAFQKMDEAQAYFGGLKNAGYFKDNAELVIRIDESFETARTAIAEQKLIDLKLASQDIDKISIRFFVGSVVMEADEAKELKGEEALEKIVEAQVFYSAVAEKFEDYDEQINAVLSSPKTVNPDTLRTLFAKGLADKVIHEIEEVISNWGNDKAAVVARESSLYMESLQAILGEKSVGDLDAIRDELTQLESAVEVADKAGSESLSKKIIEAVKNIKSAL